MTAERWFIVFDPGESWIAAIVVLFMVAQRRARIDRLEPLPNGAIHIGVVLSDHIFQTEVKDDG